MYYNDFCDRLALRCLLPKTGNKIADFCGGYGRLADEYLIKFKEAYLFDCAPGLLKQAKEKYGDSLQITQGTIYETPFEPCEFDSVIMIRASHFLSDLNSAVKEINRVLKNGGNAVIEIANKRNIFEISRWLRRKSSLRPFSFEPENENNMGFFWYHPKHVEQIFRQNGLIIKKVIAASWFCRKFSKMFWNTKLLCAMEQFFQNTVGRIKWTASLFYLLEKV